MKISVIIPAYNVEKYIQETLDSVCNSTYKDYEIILINDGSTDRTDEICKKYSEKHKEITYLTQKNQGVSAARNQGIKYAKGDWIIFVDADDKIEKNFFDFISNYSLEYDILFFGDKQSNNEKDIEIKKDDFGLKKAIVNSTITGEKISEKLAHIQLASPCAKAYRRDFLLKNHVKFPVGIKIGEDLLFNLQCYIVMKKGLFCREQVYNVTVRPGSASHRYYSDFINIDMDFQKTMLNILKKHKVYEEYKRAVYKSTVYGFWKILIQRIYVQQNHENNKQRYRLLKQVRENEIYDSAFKGITFKEIHVDEKFSKKQKLVLYLIKLKLISIAHKFIVLWDKKRMQAKL